MSAEIIIEDIVHEIEVTPEGVTVNVVPAESITIIEVGVQGPQGIPGEGVFNRKAVLFSGERIVTAADNNKLFVFTGDGNLVLPDDLSTLGEGFEIVVRHGGDFDAYVELADPQDSNILFGNGFDFYQYYLAPWQTITIAKMDNENYCVTTTTKEIPDPLFPGMALLANGTTGDSMEWDMPISPRWANHFLDDFSEYYARSYVGQWGTGASLGGGTDPGYPGLAVFNTGTTNAGGAMVAQPINSRYLPQVDNRCLIFEACFKLQDLSTSVQEFLTFFGFNDKGTTGSAAHPTNGVYFYYDRANKGNNLIARCINGGTFTDVTGPSVSAGVYYRLRIFIFRTAGTTRAWFYVGNTPFAFITTNLPSSALGYSVWMNKTVGTTNRVMYLDYYGAFESLNR